jgi:hypothetical protein
MPYSLNYCWCLYEITLANVSQSNFKSIKAIGERKAHYCLCESYRFDNTVRHQTILHLGSLEELPQTD